jgi:hypothetical protein
MAALFSIFSFLIGVLALAFGIMLFCTSFIAGHADNAWPGIECIGAGLFACYAAGKVDF